MFYDPDIFLIPIIAVALALVVFGAPYCFISDIKDLRVRWSLASAYASFLASLFMVIDLHHFYEMWAEFSLPKTMLMIYFVVVGALAGWTVGVSKTKRKDRL